MNSSFGLDIIRRLGTVAYPSNRKQRRSQIAQLIKIGTIPEREWNERRQVLHKQIEVIDLELKRLVAAISSGGDIPPWLMP